MSNISVRKVLKPIILPKKKSNLAEDFSLQKFLKSLNLIIGWGNLCRKRRKIIRRNNISGRSGAEATLRSLNRHQELIPIRNAIKLPIVKKLFLRKVSCSKAKIISYN